MLDINENYLSCNVVQGLIKKEDEDSYHIEDAEENIVIVSKSLFNKFEPVKAEDYQENSEDPVIHWTMGFIWEDGDDEKHIEYLTAECQSRCKFPILQYIDDLRAQLDKQERILMEIKYSIEK